jgi:hypothetical protein
MGAPIPKPMPPAKTGAAKIVRDIVKRIFFIAVWFHAAWVNQPRNAKGQCARGLKVQEAPLAAAPERELRG